MQQPFHTISQWDGPVGPNGKDGKIDRGLLPSRMPFSSRTRTLCPRPSRRSRRPRMSAGVVPGPAPGAHGSTPRLQPARRHTGPGRTTRRIRHMSGGAILFIPRPMRFALATTPSRRRRSGSPHNHRGSDQACKKSQNPSQNFRRFATARDDSRRHSWKKSPNQTYCSGLRRTAPDQLMSIRKPALYPLSYGGFCW